MSGGIFNELTGYHNRRSIRLRGYDYSRPGAYFVTICVHDWKQRLFGDVVDGKMAENELAGIVRTGWQGLPTHYPQIRLDEFIVMPNHIHGIIVIRDFAVGAGSSRPIDPIRGNGECDHDDNGRGNPAPTLGNMVAYFKYQTTKQMNTNRNVGIRKIWQRNYYDRIIRDEESLFMIRQYIHGNVARWGTDEGHHLLDEIDRFYAEARTAACS